MELTKTKYKQTEIGLIPEDWDVVNIGSQCQIFGRIGFRGYTVDDIVKEDQGAITLSPSNIVNGQLILKKLTYLSWLKYEESPEIKIFDGDILLVKTGSTYGKTALVKNLKQKATLNPQIVVLKKTKCDNTYLGYLMGYPIVKNQIESSVVGGAIPTLSQEQVSRFKIPLPPTLSEQKAIATALSDVDNLIANLDKLITKKKAMKQGAMQQLLTPPHKGGKRLAGFTGEWVEKTIESLVSQGGLIRGPFGGALKKEYFVSDGYKVYEQKNAIYSSVDLGRYFIDEAKFRELKRFEIQEGDFILSCSGTIGRMFRIPKKFKKGIINQALLIIRLDNKITDADYFSHQFTSDRIQQDVIDDTQGGAMKNLVGMTDFKKAIIPYPPSIEEQKSIAKILSDMDKDIEKLESKKAKYQAIKQGMMQELLTGKTRLV